MSTKILKNSEEKNLEFLRRKESQDSGLCEDFQENLKLSKQSSQNDLKSDYQLSKSESQVSQTSNVSQASMSSFYSTQFRKNSNHAYKKNQKGGNYQNNNNNGNAGFLQQQQNHHHHHNHQQFYIPQTFIPTQQVFPKDVKNPRIKYKRNDLLAIYWQMMSQIITYATVPTESAENNDAKGENSSSEKQQTVTTVPVPVCGYNGYREIIAQLPQIVGVTCDLELIENQRKNRVSNKNRNQGQSQSGQNQNNQVNKRK